MILSDVDSDTPAFSTWEEADKYDLYAEYIICVKIKGIEYYIPV